jgi:aminopeptidase YwaD
LRSRFATWAALLLAAALILSGTTISTLRSTAVAGDGTCGEPSEEGSRTWYFAEGYTGEGFQEWLTLFNPQEAWSELDLNLLFIAGSSATVRLDLPPRSRITLDINAYAGRDKEVSLYLESALPIVAERPIYFTYRGRWRGCTVTSGATSPSDTWYFAEGCTRQGFETWILLANPEGVEVPATVSLILEDGSVRPLSLTLPPRTRRTVFVNQAVGEGRDVGVKVEAGSPICAERVMYFDYHGAWPGGHASSGLSKPRKTHLFAEGYTGAGFEEWLTLYAPLDSVGGDGTDVTLNCLFQGGEEQSFQAHLDPDKRYTLNINQLVGEGKDVSMELSAGEPFLAERPMYFNYKGACRGGHVSKGVEAAGTHWYLAEGTTRSGFYEYLCLMNPGDESAGVTIDIASAQTTALTQGYIISGRSRLTIDIRALIGTGMDTSFEIDSDRPIAVERSLYYPTDSFEVANAMDNLWNLSVNIGLRVEGTAGELAAADYLKGVLEGYGYTVEIQEVPLPNGSATRNVIAHPIVDHDPVEGRAAESLVVGGHYDTKTGTGSPGANDNGSGTIVVLELARCMAEKHADLPIEFILFGGEEQLINGTDLHHFGSRYYVDKLSQAEKDNMIGAIVVDMVGVGSQLYARTMGIGPMDLCNHLLAYAQGAGISLPYMVSGSYSDHEPFEKAGIPAVWLEYKDDPWYHTPGDSYDKVNPTYIENTGRLLEGFIRSL